MIAGLYDAASLECATHVIAQLRLCAIERDQLVSQEFIGALIELVPIQRAFSGAGRKVGCQGIVLSDIPRIEPIEQAIDS